MVVEGQIGLLVTQTRYDAKSHSVTSRHAEGVKCIVYRRVS